MRNGAELLRFVVLGGRRCPQALLRVPSLFVKKEKVIVKVKEKEKEREDAVKCFNTFACLSEDGEHDNEFSLLGVSSRVPVLETLFLNLNGKTRNC